MSRHCDGNLIGLVILETVLIAFLHNKFRLLPGNSHDVEKARQTLIPT
jgi:hypothetical protein